MHMSCLEEGPGMRAEAAILHARMIAQDLDDDACILLGAALIQTVQAPQYHRQVLQAASCIRDRGAVLLDAKHNGFVVPELEEADLPHPGAHYLTPEGPPWQPTTHEQCGPSFRPGRAWRVPSRIRAAWTFVFDAEAWRDGAWLNDWLAGVCAVTCALGLMIFGLLFGG